MKYRQDIDGLRAVAVISVLMFHGGFSWFPGGFVGVDVFFAISGFLITSIIYTKMLTNTFSFSDFYTRRARRLLPASFFMIVTTVLVFALIYPPDLFATLAGSAKAALLFFANFFFWKTSGYFDSSIALQPLLHTWTLSVEEQFYFVVPVFLLIGVMFAKRYVLLLLSLACAISLFLAIYFAPNELTFFSFYLLPTRFYEMGLGALVAIYLCNNNISTKRYYLRELGILCILTAVFFYDKSLAFPSFYPLLPVIGTLLVIVDRSTKGFVYQLLKNKTTVWIGLLSYSLYLWHWPVAVLLNWYELDANPIAFSLLYLTLSCILAVLSFYCIEQPMRQAEFYSLKFSKISVYALSIFLAGLTVHLQVNGNQSILNKPEASILKYMAALPSEEYRDECTDRKRLHGVYEVCTLKHSSQGLYNIFLWGDSHASSLMSALLNTSDKINVRAFNTSGCPSLLGINRKNNSDCEVHNEFVKQYLSLNYQNYDLVLHVSAWNNYLDMNAFEKDDGTTASDVLQYGFASTTKFYEGIDLKYVFFSQFPNFKEHVPLFYFKHNIQKVTLSKETVNAEAAAVFAIFHGAEHISLTNYICDTELCFGGNENILFYRDSHHISNQFGKVIAKSLESTIITVIDGGVGAKSSTSTYTVLEAQ